MPGWERFAEEGPGGCEEVGVEFWVTQDVAGSRPSPELLEKVSEQEAVEQALIQNGCGPELALFPRSEQRHGDSNTRWHDGPGLDEVSKARGRRGEAVGYHLVVWTENRKS